MEVINQRTDEIFQCNVTFQTSTKPMDTDEAFDFEGLQSVGRKCLKEKDHDKFISFNELSISDFPEPYRHLNFLTLARSLGDLVVKIELSKTSPDRPNNFPRYCRFGTGKITFSKIIKGTKSRHCICRDCRTSSEPQTEWAEIKVTTAAHVIFNLFEAENAVCILHFNQKDATNIVTLKEKDTENVSVNNDRSTVIFVTHDIKLASTLRKSIYFFKRQHTKIFNEFNILADHKLAILISHPHGEPKQVSLGTYTKTEIDGKRFKDKVYTKYTYDLHSCPGSSGAPLYFLGKKDVWSLHPHSGSTSNGNAGNIVSTGHSSTEWEKV
ncbi:uncharacterized protein LOC106060563 [Biomphalaria glabrata]|uniref:Uncharacterized protein LOC106060563 n=1 Tax=Biomphalaria glabrata TaxID=6526 RepID=A0A9U8E5G8_BIOGL|nr:uncharacterized protein LOC106060563 [Biomphalaria glabrata]